MAAATVKKQDCQAIEKGRFTDNCCRCRFRQRGEPKSWQHQCAAKKSGLPRRRRHKPGRQTGGDTLTPAFRQDVFGICTRFITKVVLQKGKCGGVHCRRRRRRRNCCHLSIVCMKQPKFGCNAACCCSFTGGILGTDRTRKQFQNACALLLSPPPPHITKRLQHLIAETLFRN